MNNRALTVFLWVVAFITFLCCSSTIIFYKIWYSNIPEEVVILQKYFLWLPQLWIPALVFIVLQLILHIVLLITRINSTLRFLLFVFVPLVLSCSVCYAFLTLMDYWLEWRFLHSV